MAHKDERFLDDAESLRAIIEQMQEGDRALYKSYGALTLESAFPNRIMVVYTLKGGAPDNLEVLNFGNMEMSRIGGPTFTIECNRKVVEVGVTPHKWPGRDLFFHVPQNFVLRWAGKNTPRGIQYVLHFAILIKSLSREHLQIDGHAYAVTLNNFKARFPRIRATYQESRFLPQK